MLEEPRDCEADLNRIASNLFSRRFRDRNFGFLPMSGIRSPAVLVTRPRPGALSLHPSLGLPGSGLPVSRFDRTVASRFDIAPMPLIFDAHLDLAWNAVSYNRDLALPLDEVRRREQSMHDVPGRGHGVLSLPELRQAGVAVCVATLLARCGLDQRPQTAYQRQIWNTPRRRSPTPPPRLSSPIIAPWKSRGTSG